MAKKLLLADDSITIQKVVSITLANEDLEIVAVDNGEDAIAKAIAIHPDLVLADASMPKKDGYQVAEALKSNPATASIPVLILAGQLEGHPDQARLASCRADGFIPKPFESQLLIDRVRRTIGLAGPVTRPVPAPAAPTQPKAPTPPPPVARPAAPTQPVATPAPAPRPVAAPPTPTQPMPAASPAPTMINEADFGELSAQPAASGDQDLWGNQPLAAQPIAAEDNLWGGMEPSQDPTPSPAAMPTPAVAMPAAKPAAAAPALSPTLAAALAAGADSNGGADPMGFDHPAGDPSAFVTNPAELANIGAFEADSVPSGLDLDESVPRVAPKRAGDDNLVHANDAAAAAMAAQAGQITVSPEQLEKIVREIVQKMIGPILEKIAWEVVPDLAEDIIREELKRLTSGVSGVSKTG